MGSDNCVIVGVVEKIESGYSHAFIGTKGVYPDRTVYFRESETGRIIRFVFQSHYTGHKEIYMYPIEKEQLKENRSKMADILEYLTPGKQYIISITSLNPDDSPSIVDGMLIFKNGYQRYGFTCVSTETEDVLRELNDRMAQRPRLDQLEWVFSQHDQRVHELCLNQVRAKKYFPFTKDEDGRTFIFTFIDYSINCGGKQIKVFAAAYWMEKGKDGFVDRLYYMKLENSKEDFFLYSAGWPSTSYDFTDTYNNLFSGLLRRAREDFYKQNGFYP